MDRTSPASATLPCPIAPYVPQTRGMCLLERIVAVDDDSLEAEVTPTADGIFAHEGGVPAWVGVEWMAQAAAAWAGWQAAARSEAPAVGFLIGTRRFETLSERFATGATFRVAVRLDFRADNGLGQFHGEIRDRDDTRLAQGTLSVFQPGSPDAPPDETPNPGVHP